MTYFGTHIRNTRDGKFAVVCREGSVRTLDWRHVYDSFEEAYKTAKVWSFGGEIVDETTHH